MFGLSLRKALLVGALAVSTGTAAQAQVAGSTRIVPLTFTGVVSGDPAASIQIRQPDLSYVPYTGPVPANASYRAGDAVTITMNATLPTKAYYESLAAAGANLPADGIYRLKLSSTLNGSNTSSGQIGYVSPAQISGDLNSVGYYGEPNYTTISIIYDSKTDTYALDGTGSFRDEGVVGAGFTYDPASGIVSACSGRTCAPQSASDNGTYSLVGGADGSITSSFSYIWDAAANILGRFTLGLTGSWNLPTYGSGGATPVPEPGMMALFGAAALVPVWRRRRRGR
jgi:hypothetical protein